MDKKQTKLNIKNKKYIAIPEFWGAIIIGGLLGLIGIRLKKG